MADQVTSTVLMRYKVENKDARRKIKQLEKENAKLAKATIKQQEQANKSLDAQIAMWGKVAVGIGAAVVAFQKLKAASEKYAKTAQLQLAATGANIEKIAAAAGGLISQYEALEFAAAALNTDFKLSQREMEEVSKFMVVLRNQGNDMATVQRGVQKAIVEGSARALKEFGVIIDDVSTGTMEAHLAIMRRIREENDKAGDTLLIAGDEMLVASKNIENALFKIETAFGRLAQEIAPVLTLLSGVVEQLLLIGQLKGLGAGVENLKTLGGIVGPSGGRDIFAAMERRKGLTGRLLRQGRAAVFKARGEEGFSPLLGGGGRLGGTLRQGQAAIFAALGKIAETKLPGRKPTLGPERGQAYIDRLVASQGGAARALAGPSAALGAGQAPGFGTGLAGGLEAPAVAGAMPQAEEVSKSFNQVIDGSFAATQAIDSFAIAGAQAFGALITGSESFAKAFKKAIGDSMIGMAMQMTATAIQQGVFALGNVALGIGTGSPAAWKAAKAHGAAAAEAAGAALVIGGLAKLMGAGQSTGGGAVPSGGAGAFAGASAGQGGTSTTIFVGSDFGDNPRANAARLGQAFDRRRELEGEESAVVFA